jgi:nicotinate-nucleotide pyrophosphorylase (carboxylating)
VRKLLGAFDAPPPGPDVIDPLVERALEEDAAFADRSTLPLAAREERRRARIVAREAGVLAGVPVARRVFERLAGDATVRVEDGEDGLRFAAGDTVLRVAAPAGALLAGERTALNFLQRLSGVATATRRFVVAAAGRLAVCDTRKTTPGLRALEKHAVLVGGGTSHRRSLGDMVMLKENHLALAGGIAAAVAAVRADPASAALPLTVEVRTHAEALEAAALGVDRLLLDNMTDDAMRRVAADLGPAGARPELEASGGIRPERMEAIAAAGVDLVSVGGLTNGAPSIDLSFLLDTVPGR